MSRRTPRKALPPRTAAWLRDQLALLDRGRADGDDGTAEERYGLRKGAEFAAKLEREMLARRLETLRVLAQLAVRATCRPNPGSSWSAGSAGSSRPTRPPPCCRR